MEKGICKSLLGRHDGDGSLLLLLLLAATVIVTIVAIVVAAVAKSGGEWGKRRMGIHGAALFKVVQKIGK